MHREIIQNRTSEKVKSFLKVVILILR